MLIQCKLKREGGTKVNLDGVEYHFCPQVEGGPDVAEVENKDHQMTLLSISEGYCQVKKPKPAKASKKSDEDEDEDSGDGDSVTNVPASTVTIGVEESKGVSEVHPENAGEPKRRGRPPANKPSVE